ncbi:MAG: Extended Signal Peptide of Type secretion system [Pseudomonadota bacterium]|jgi:hypothetical protein
MNKIYRIIWSKLTNTWVVVSELAKGHKSGSGSNVDKSKIYENNLDNHSFECIDMQPLKTSFKNNSIVYPTFIAKFLNILIHKNNNSIAINSNLSKIESKNNKYHTNNKKSLAKTTLSIIGATCFATSLLSNTAFAGALDGGNVNGDASNIAYGPNSYAADSIVPLLEDRNIAIGYNATAGSIATSGATAIGGSSLASGLH